MVQFSEAFPDPEIVATLRRQLSWAHFKLLIPIKDPLKRDYYVEMCRTGDDRQEARRFDRAGRDRREVRTGVGVPSVVVNAGWG